MSRIKTKHIVFTVLIGAFLALVIYRMTKSGEEEAAPKGGGGGKGGARPAMTLNAVVVKPTVFANSLSVTGALEADQQVQITSQTTGLVTKVSFAEGTYVKKGQVLVTIDDAELRARLSEVNTNQSLARETERRAGLLIRSGAISRQEYDAAVAGLRASQAQTQLIQAQLAKTVIRAPFSGKVGLSTVTVGQYLTASDPIASLVNLNPIRITFSVPEKYSGKVTLNTALHFKVSGSDKSYTAMVYAIEPSISQSTRTLQLKARTQNPAGELVPGAFAEVQLPISTIYDAILIPSEAIVPIQNGQKVFVVEKGKAKEVVVQGSTRTTNQVLINAGLKAGDTVITSGNMALKPGTPVKVRIQAQ